MRFINALVRHKHISTHTSEYNPLWIIPLGIFTVVSTLPHNALAFESTLSHSSINKSRALVQDSIYAPYQSNVVIATSTLEGLKADPVPEPIPEPAPEPQPAIAVSQPVSNPGSDAVLVLEGEASYYSRAGCLGCSPTLTMANGQPLDDSALTMAIGANRRQYLGRQARVTNLHTGQSVVVRITDTGGFYQARYNNRVADLTVATKNAIGMAGGTGQVRVEVF